MSSSENEIAVAIREEMQAGFALFANEVRCVVDRLDGVSDRLDGVSDRLDGVSDRLDGVSDRLDRTNDLLLETRTEMSSKLTGISSFLIQSEQNHDISGKRLDSIERRLRKLENK